MNNIYIGNRYVPIFADPVEWNDSREYEPLTIVTHSGTSYTSRKRVPLGVPITNEEYWVVTGNYNAQVEFYRREVAEVVEDLDELSSSVDTRFNTMEQSVNTRFNALSTSVDTRFANVNKQLDLQKFGTVVCIGDSYLEGWTPSGDVTSWGTYLARYLGKTVNTNFFMFSQGGAGFINVNQGKNFLSLLDDAKNRITDASSVGLVVVLGGANDPSANLASAIGSFCNTAMRYFPNSLVYYGYGSEFVSANPYTVTNKLNQFNSALTGAVYMGGLFKYLSGYSDLFYSSDLRHPNANGQEKLAQCVYRCLYGAGIGEISRGDRTVAHETIEYISNDTWNLYCFGNISSDISISNHRSNGTELLASIPLTNSYLNKTDDGYFRCDATGMIADSTRYYPATFRLRIKPDKIEVYDFALNADCSDYHVGGVRFFQINCFRYQQEVTVI